MKHISAIWQRAFVLFALLAMALPAHAHVGSKDIFEQVTAGPYKLFVTIRPPDVIPGVAVIEVRTTGSVVSGLQITPSPLTGEAAAHPPAADAMQRSTDDPAFFTGSLWLMSPGSWQVRFRIQGEAGAATTSVPVPAMPLSVLPMTRSLGILLAALGVVLILGMVGIVTAAVRESSLTPGATPPPARRRRAMTAGIIAFAVVVGMAVLGGRWWSAEAAGYARGIYRPMHLTPSLSGNTLDLKIASTDEQQRQRRSNADLLLDHGHLMHLYAIRQPGMDAAFHLHPSLVAAGDLRMTLPAMPPGEYKLYGDIVHANGFPETLTASLTVPPNMSSAPLASEDAAAATAPLDKGDLGPVFKLPDGYTMVWDRPATLTANSAYAFRFRLLDKAGKPATDMQPYLGMAGHAAFVKADGTTFAHTHPEGSAAMPAMMLANGESSSGSSGMDMNMDMGSGDMSGMNMASNAAPAQPIAPTVDFPYGFPAPGRYRIFIQMKHSNTVETGVFDAEVHP